MLNEGFYTALHAADDSGNSEYFAILHRELDLAHNARLAYEGFIHGNERPMTIAQDVACTIESHIDSGDTDYRYAVY